MRAWRSVVLVLSLCSLLMPACLLAQALPTAALSDSAKVLAAETISPNRVDWLPLVDHERLILTVAGPQDLYIRQEFGAGQAPFLGLFDAKGNPLPDGTYSYELSITPRQKSENGKPLRHSGYLTVRGGSFINMIPLQPKVPVSRSPLKPISAEQIIAERSCIGPACTTGDQGEPLMLKDQFTQLVLYGDVPTVYFRDDDPGGDSGDHSWVIQANERQTFAEFLALWDVDAYRKVLIVEGDAPANSLYMRSNGNIGLGTSTPAERLHVLADSNANSIIVSENTNTGANAAGVLRAQSDTATVNFQAHGSGRTITRFGQTLAGWGEFLVPSGNGLIIGTLNSHPLILGTTNTNRLHITPGGAIGIGTATPAKRLTVKSAGGNDDVLQVVKSSGSTSLFRVFETTNGDGLLSLYDYTGAEAARFSSVAGGRLAIGCNAPEYDLDLGNSPGTACSAVGSRSYIDAGSTTFTTSSSRTIKENLKPIQVPGILDKISSVGVYNYDFITGPKNKVGLIAEDFHTVFGRGSDKEINGQEVEMALWLAVQELTAQNKELRDRLADIEARLQQ